MLDGQQHRLQLVPTKNASNVPLANSNTRQAMNRAPNVLLANSKTHPGKARAPYVLLAN